MVIQINFLFRLIATLKALQKDEAEQTEFIERFLNGRWVYGPSGIVLMQIKLFRLILPAR